MDQNKESILSKPSKLVKCKQCNVEFENEYRNLFCNDCTRKSIQEHVEYFASKNHFK